MFPIEGCPSAQLRCTLDIESKRGTVPRTGGGFMAKLTLVLVLVVGAFAAAMSASWNATEATDSIGTDEVRIQARKLSDGRIEFGLQQKNGGGQWGEDILPASRFFPADAPAGRWLSSTPLTSVVSLNRPSNFRYVRGWIKDLDNDRIRYTNQREAGFDGANTYLVVDGRTNDRAFPNARLIISCRHANHEGPSEMWMIAAAYRGDSTPLRPRDTAPIAPLDESNPVAYYRIEPWRSTTATALSGGWIRFDRPEELYKSIITASSAEIVPPTLEVEANLAPGNRIKMSFWSSDVSWGVFAAGYVGLRQCEQDRFETDSRIAARRLENGQVEFALQHRTATGWSEHMLPKVRKFPADASVDTWLYSSPIILTTPDNHVERPRPMDGALEGRTYYTFAGSDLVPSVTVFGETDHAEHRLAEVTVGCDGNSFNGELRVRAVLLSTDAPEWRQDDPYQSPYLGREKWYATYAYPVSLGTARWPLVKDRYNAFLTSEAWTRYSGGDLYQADNPKVTRQAVEQLQRAREIPLQFQFSDDSDTVTAMIDVSNLFETPVQPWLDWCVTWPYHELQNGSQRK